MEGQISSENERKVSFVLSEALVKLREKMRKNGIDATVLSGGSNRRYFSGFTGTAGTVLVTENDALFMTDSRYTIQAGRQCRGFEVRELSGKPLLDFMSDFFREHGITKVWIDEEEITFAGYKALKAAVGEAVELKEGTRSFSEIRMIKTDEEIRIMREAAELSGKAFMQMLDEMHVGQTELEAARNFEKHVLELGAQLSFIIVASGENGACPHNVPSDRKIRYSDLVTVDFGVIYKGYNSDCTRTFAVGEVSDKLKEIFSVVADAQRQVREAIKPGMICCDIDRLSREIIGKAGYGQYFGHGLGHSLGLDIHEAPSLNKVCRIPLEKGMLVTDEPGIYIEGLGGVRIEDTLLVTENGAESITDNVPKDIIIKEF